MINVDDLARSVIKRNERDLNDALATYDATSPDDPLRVFWGLVVQVQIFSYDIALEVSSILRADAVGFAEAVALKGLVHRLYEYDAHMRAHWLQAIVGFSKGAKIELDAEELKKIARRWRPQLKAIRRLEDVRNRASAHYDTDIDAQIASIRQLNRSEALDLQQAFVLYLHELMQLFLRGAQKRNDKHPL